MARKHTKKTRTSNPNGLFNRERWENFYFNQLANVVWQMFEWKNLPKTINPIFLERQLHDIGCIAFYDDPILGKMAVTGAWTELSPYQEPLNFQAAMWRYTERFPLRTFLTPDEEAIRDNMGIFCPNMQGGFLGINSTSSSSSAIRIYAAMLAEIRMTYLVALQNLKMPFIIETDDDNLLSARNLINQVQQNEPAIFVNKNGHMDLGFKIHMAQHPAGYEALDKLILSHKETLNEFLTFFGINNFGTNKKERLITSEVSANSEFIRHSLNKFLFPRQMTADVLNTIWGTNIEVNLRSDIELLIEAELGILDPSTNDISLNSSGGEENG